MNDLVAPPRPAKPANAALSHAANNPTTGQGESCPSCDKTGLAVLVALWAVIPPQNYPASIRENKNYVNHSAAAAMFGEGSYLTDRPLNRAKAGGSLECSQYVLRRLRKGFLHVYYPSDNQWEVHEVQADGRLLRVNLDSPRPMGKGDAACKRFNTSSSSFLLTVDAKKHKAFKIGFSDAFWTASIRNKLAGDPMLAAKFMKEVDCSNPASMGGGLHPAQAQMIEDTVLGFQARPQTDTIPQEFYSRPKSIAASTVHGSMVTLNRAFDPSGKVQGVLLPLHDDIGIATQLNFARNRALTDIMGESEAYKEIDRQKMDAAALLDNIRQSSADVWSRIDDDIDLGAFESYLAKYVACAEATANFNVYSADYTGWMDFLSSKPYSTLFDPELPASCAKLAEISAALYVGCGQTKDEFNKVLLKALAENPEDGNHLFWRGAAANDQGVLSLLLDPSIDKTLVDSQKKFDELKGQRELLGEIKAARANAAAANAAHWDQLAALLNSRARRLRDANPKAFRRTMRRIQALTLHHNGMGVLEVALEGDVSGYLRQLRNAASATPNAQNIRITPRNAGQIRALSHLIAASWKPGEPIPAALRDAQVTLGIGADELPPYSVTNIENPKESIAALKKVGALTAGMGALQAFSLFTSLQKLGVDLAEAQASGPNMGRITRDVGEATAALLSVVAVSMELRAITETARNSGAKNARAYGLGVTAARLGMIAAAIEGGFQIYDSTLLWEQGDKTASLLKGVAGGSSIASAGLGYAATRMIARQAAVGIAGEVAASAAAASAVTRGGAVVTVEAPPVALWLSIASIGLFAVSVGADGYSKYFTTIPMEKWADRTFLGKRSGKWGKPFATSKEQLETLLRELYAIKISTPGYFDALLKFEVEVPVWGTESEIDLELKLDGKVLRRYIYKPGGAPIDSPTWQLHVKEGDGKEGFRGTGTAKGQGAVFAIEMGDQSWQEAAKNVVLGVVTPIARAISGIPSIAVKYSPNTAAHAGFVIDGKSE